MILHRIIESVTAARKRIVLVGGVPIVGWDVPTVLALSKLHGVDLPKPIFREQLAGREKLADEMLAKLSQQPDIVFVPVWDLLCPAECIITSDGRPLYSNDDHLSAFGAGTFLGPPVRDRFRMAQAAP